MIKYNPQFKSDGTQNGALTSAPSDSIIFDVPGKCIWVKGVKLATSHTYTFSHDNYITLTNTPGEPEDILIGVNTTALKNAIDTTYGIVNASTNGLAPMFSTANKATASAATTYNFLGIAGSTLKWYQLPWRNVRINSDSTDKLGVNSTDPLIISQGDGISVTWDATNKKIVISNTAPDQDHNTDYTTINKGTAGSTTAVTQVKTLSSAGVIFEGGTNKFKVGDGTNYFEIPITPSFTVTDKAASILATDTTLATINGTDITAKVAVVDSSPTLTTSLKTIATIAGVEIKAKITNYNTDENVKQVDNNNNENVPILLKNGTGTGTITSSVRTVDGVTINPSTNSLSVGGNLNVGGGSRISGLVQLRQLASNTLAWIEVYSNDWSTRYGWLGTSWETSTLLWNGYTIYHSGNLPAYPTVNNASLTLQTAGTTLTTFYANDSTNRTFNVTCANIGAATSSHQHNMNDIKWPGSHNLITSATANGQEWSIDCTPGTYTGTYWQVWRATTSGISVSGTMLKVDCDTGKVSAPYGFVGNLSGTATSAGNADTLDGYHASSFKLKTSIWLPASKQTKQVFTTFLDASTTNLHNQAYEELNFFRFYSADEAASNYGYPVVDSHSLVFSIDNNKNWIRVLNLDIRTNDIYTIAKTNNSWGSWVKLLHTGNISPALNISGNTIAITVGGITSSYITVPYATNSDTVDGYHASQLWRSNGATWNPGANVSLSATANSLEWSFDMTRNGYTGTRWHVWDSSRSSMLIVTPDDGKVSAPYGFVGNIEGNATSATTASKLSTVSKTIWGLTYWTSGGVPTNVDGNQTINFSSGYGTYYKGPAGESSIEFYCNGTSKAVFGAQPSSAFVYNRNRGNFLRYNDNGTLTFEGYTVWHSGNDGSGSGLDADLLDGYHYNNLPYLPNNSTWIPSSLTNAGMTRRWGFLYSGACMGWASNNSEMYVYTDGAFYLREGAYRCLDTGDNVAWLASHNNLTASGNEFTFASSGFSGGIWINYRTAGGTNGNITEYYLGNGKGGSLGTAIHSGNYTTWCAAKSHTHDISQITWAPSSNLVTTLTANSLEWSIDIYRNGYTGGYWHIWDSSLGSLFKVYPDNGNTWSRGTSTATHFYESSDIRLKHDISMMSKSIRRFRFNNDNKLYYGFIAQELETLHPELVDSSGEYKTVNYNSAICYYIAELENKVQKLEDEINKLKNK